MNYSYTLSATIDNDSITAAGNDTVDGTGFDDSVALTVHGIGGTTGGDNLVVRIVDATPTAANDGPFGVVEDGASSLSGNVLLNDASGADTPASFVSWSSADTTAIAALNTYGTLTQNGNGTWSYTLDNGRAVTQALTASSNLSYTLNYTMQDADGDTSPATLTITITGAADSASVATAQATGPDATVFEAGLTVPNTTETTGGTFTVSATDGIQNIVIGGTTFTLAQVQAFGTTNGVVNTGEGVLRLTGYTGTSTSGTVNYSYTLSATIDNDSKIPTGNDSVNGTGFNDSVALTVNGIGGTTASDNLVILVADDTPVANDDTDSFGNQPVASSISGNVIDGTNTNEQLSGTGDDTLGADGGSVTFIAHTGGTGGDLPGAGAAGATIVGAYGNLVMQSNGDYTYTRTSNSAGTDQFTYTVTDGDGDPDTATLTIALDSAGALIVGSNQNDDETAPPSNTAYDHVVPNGPAGTHGDIIGTTGDDIIVGDPGAQGTVTAGDTANIVLVLDTSGSMSAGISFDGNTVSRLQALQIAAIEAIDALSNSAADNVRIHLVQFNEQGGPGITFDLITNGAVNAAQVAAAKAVVDGFDDTFDGPATNYQSALQQVVNWVQGSNVTFNSLALRPLTATERRRTELPCL